MSRKPRIVILGGGFAGMAAARALQDVARRGDASVEVWDRSPESVMLPALPDYAAGFVSRAPLTGSIRSRLPNSVGWRLETARAVHLDDRLIATDSGPVAYDALVIATGSASRAAHTQWKSGSSYPLASLEEAERLRVDFPRYLEQTEAPHLLFSGGGYTAVELACALRKHVCMARGKACRITVVDRQPEILPFLSERHRQRLTRHLAACGIEVRTSATVSGFDGRDAVLECGTRFKNVFLCRTEGTGPALDAQGTRCGKEKDGRMAVESTLQVKGYPMVFAAGDAAAIRAQGTLLRKAVNFSIYSGASAGRNLARQLTHRPMRAFRPVDLGWVVPMGDDSVGQAFGRFPMQGRPGLMLHYVMCGFRNYSLRNFLAFVGLALRCSAGKNVRRPGRGRED